MYLCYVRTRTTNRLREYTSIYVPQMRFVNYERFGGHIVCPRSLLPRGAHGTRSGPAFLGAGWWAGDPRERESNIPPDTNINTNIYRELPGPGPGYSAGARG